ncbi:hypothetical protein D7T48_01555 [Stenotrophomonas maltophilia]|uniref:hypothetical protein n=1 Tax=Stenotrophomonas TaxID=40323 RepID=UPI001310D296|nr:MULTISPECIES: hypothetical protein [Stenotrophomonas]ELC7322303.1 hypothetical protein [Stenotrophomonas maltophilia]ELC7324874.1 hypothetical protein [Stenotrophomonas maltophilia]MBA0276531.1 hypothetical protein [Stenotrophomonas maltophilia]MBA0412718.1 hypothetical protein [Stenotrophomonas maltophilia]MBA0496215.1 hypothetical protein [Stenotrophomonas maltophilia]
MSSQTIDEMIQRYVASTSFAIKLLFDQKLLHHSLVIMYSAIDTCGLLDAPVTQTEATGTSFKEWVKKYVLAESALEFNDVDLWAARCAVLHTFTPKSKLSQAGGARQLHYYTGDDSDAHIQKFTSEIRALDNGKHLPVHYGDLAQAILLGMGKFMLDLAALCEADAGYADRVRDIIQVYERTLAP